MISFLLLIYENRNWYHWKARLFFFTMMCHLPWLCNHGMCSTPEYRAKSEVKCCKMHCFQHWSLHFSSYVNVVSLESLIIPLSKWCVICNAYAIMECAVLLNMQQGQKWNVAKFVVFNSEFPFVLRMDWVWMMLMRWCVKVHSWCSLICIRG